MANIITHLLSRKVTLFQTAITKLTDNSGGAATNTLAATTLPAAVTDNSGGAATTTIAAVTDSASAADAVASLAARQGEDRTAISALRNATASNAAKINSVIDALKKAGITV